MMGGKSEGMSKPGSYSSGMKPAGSGGIGDMSGMTAGGPSVPNLASPLGAGASPMPKKIPPSGSGSVMDYVGAAQGGGGGGGGGKKSGEMPMPKNLGGTNPVTGQKQEAVGAPAPEGTPGLSGENWDSPLGSLNPEQVAALMEQQTTKQGAAYTGPSFDATTPDMTPEQRNQFKNYYGVGGQGYAKTMDWYSGGKAQ